jgi:hypothetical protein
MADIFGAIGAASNRALGTLGRGIDVIGNAAGNRLPELKWFGDEGLSGALEYQGSKSMPVEQRVEERVSQGKPIAGADAEVARNRGLDFTYDPNIGIKGDKPAYNNQEAASGATKIATGGKLTMGEAAALGLDQSQLWHNNEIVIQGQKVRVVDNGDGTRSFVPVKSSSGNAPSGADKARALQQAGDDILRNLSQDNVNDLLKKQFDNMNDFAKEIERVARENAEREYRTILEALGRQKGEVAQLASEQKENITRQGEMVEEELGIRSEREQREIDKQRTGFIEGVEETKDQLARNWRDMSLQVQRIMRGRGISDSTFASSEELKVLRDFNQGLRQLAVKKSGALKDFADAITETVSFYERKKVELAEEVRVSLQKVDQWVRQRTIDIQNQEGMALSNKLREINEANLRAESLRTNIKNEILQKQMDYDMWLKQTEVNYKLAVAQAAQGKVQSAADQIKEAAAVSKNMFTLLQNGQAHFVDMGNGQEGIQDLLTGSVIPTNTGFKDQYEHQQKLQQQILEQRAQGGGSTTDLLLRQMLGLQPQSGGGGALLSPQQEEEQKGLLGGIMQGLGF